MTRKLDLQHVQADEIRGKGWKMIPWIDLAMMVSTRLWLGGVVSLRRDRHLAETLPQMVKSCCQPLGAVLILTDGWAAYPGSIRRAFREKVKGAAGRGRCRLQAWPEVLMGTVIKKTAKKRVVEVIRRLTQGEANAAIALLCASGGGTQLNTAFIERLNATFRERLATRRAEGLSAPGGHVARRVYLQLLLASSRIEPERGPCTGVQGRSPQDSGDGFWTHRSRLECARTAHLPRPAACMGRPKAAGTTSDRDFACQEVSSCTIATLASFAKGGLMSVHHLWESYQTAEVCTPFL